VRLAVEPVGAVARVPLARYGRIPNMSEPAAANVSANDPGPVATVRYWAGARAAAGVESDRVPVGEGTSLADVLDAVRRLHADRPRLPDVLTVCSVLIGEKPVGATDPAEVVVSAGDTVELLPPFAGGARDRARTTDR
jgi:molybdopterin converting factor small subunit